MNYCIKQLKLVYHNFEEIQKFVKVNLFIFKKNDNFLFSVHLFLFHSYIKTLKTKLH